MILLQIKIDPRVNSFYFLKSFIRNGLDVLLTSDIKHGDIFSMAQILLYGFKKPYRLDCCLKHCSIRLFVRENISSHLFK